jgi:hypothetical protein
LEREDIHGCVADGVAHRADPLLELVPLLGADADEHAAGWTYTGRADVGAAARESRGKWSVDEQAGVKSRRRGRKGGGGERWSGVAALRELGAAGRAVLAGERVR